MRLKEPGLGASVARELFGWQLALLLILILGAGAAAVFDARRDADDSTRQTGHRGHRVGREDELDRGGHRVPRPDRGTAAADRSDPQGHRDRLHRRDGAGPDPVHPHRRHPDRRPVHRQHRPGAGRRRRSPRPTPARSGPSIRAVAPVRDARRRRSSAWCRRASPGPESGRACWPPCPRSRSAVGTALLLALVGAIVLERRLRRRTLGLSFPDLRALYEQREAVLHSIGEGLLVFDTDGRAEVVNDEARRLLSLPPGPVTPSAAARVAGQHRRRRRSPTKPMSPPTGCCWSTSNRCSGRTGWSARVMTLRDRTDLQRVSGELSSVTQFAESLRSRAHEADNRLHTVITMVELGRADDAVQFATAELAVSQQLIDRLMSTVAEPALAALLLGKMSQARDHGVELTVTEDSLLDDPDSVALTQGELVTLVGNLVDNAIDAARAEAPGWVEVTVRGTAQALTVAVADSGPGMSADAFEQARMRGYSTKGGRTRPRPGAGVAGDRRPRRHDHLGEHLRVGDHRDHSRRTPCRSRSRSDDPGSDRRGRSADRRGAPPIHRAGTGFRGARHRRHR